MPLQKIAIEVDIPDGYDVIGYGEPKINDLYLYDGKVQCWTFPRDPGFSVILLRRRQIWRDVTVDDLTHLFRHGPLDARVTHGDRGPWVKTVLIGAKILNTASGGTRLDFITVDGPFLHAQIQKDAPLTDQEETDE